MSIAELAGRESAWARRRRWAHEGPLEAPVVVRTPRRRLEHALHDALWRWSSLRGRAAVERDPEYRRRLPEVRALLHGFAWDLRAATADRPRRPGGLRAVAWNVERGKRFEALCGVLREHPRLRDADVLLLSEVDVGMGRSANRDVAAELAHRLGMGYVFATSHLVLSAGDSSERDHGLPNGRALHGVALLTRFPVRRVCGVGLPEFSDKLGAVERRLGAKRALLAELDTPGAPLTVALVHLDPFSSPDHRGAQMRRVVEALPRLDARHVLVGGDFNTNTYVLGSSLGMARDICTKVLSHGFAGTVAHYMIPEQHVERPVFEALAAAGLSPDGLVDPRSGTLRYDLNDPEYLDKTQRTLPGPMVRWLLRRLEPWGGTVPMRLDWFAGRGLTPREAWTAARPRYRGAHISDHDPVGVDLRWPPEPDAGSTTG